MSELVFLLSADIDIQRVHDFYARYQEGRGVIFPRELDRALGQLRRFPQSGPRVHKDWRRLLVPRFPLVIFCTLEARGVIVAGVLEHVPRPGG